MKKLLTALIAFVMCFSVVTTAFAATPDETSDSDLISDIKQAMLDTYYGDEKPEYLNVEILLDDEDEVYFSFSQLCYFCKQSLHRGRQLHSFLPRKLSCGTVQKQQGLYDPRCL